MENEKNVNVQIYRDGQWQDIELKDLKVGDVFRAFSNGSPIRSTSDDNAFIAISNPMSPYDDEIKVFHNVYNEDSADKYAILAEPYADDAISNDTDNASNEETSALSKKYKRAERRLIQLSHDPEVSKYIHIINALSFDADDMMDIIVDDEYDIENNNDWIRAMRYYILDEMIGSWEEDTEWEGFPGFTRKEAAYIKHLKDNLEELVKKNDPKLNRIIELSGIFDKISSDNKEVEKRMNDAIASVVKESNINK